MSRRTRPLLAAGAVAAAFLAFGSQPALAQVDWAKRVQELKLESQLMQQGVSLMMDGRGLEAAEQMEQHMRSAGVTPTRLAQKCNYLEFAGEMGLFSDCVKAYRGLLVNGRIPPRQNEPTPAETAQSETDLVYFNLPRFYKTLGDYKSALEVGEAGLGLVKIRSIRFLLLEQVAGVHLKLGNRDKAQAILREVERWQPNAGEIVSRNAAMQNLSAALGDFDSALKYFDEIEKGAASPDKVAPGLRESIQGITATRAMVRAWFLLELKRLPEARSEVERAERLVPGMSEGIWAFQDWVGRIAEGEGRTEAALAAYRKAIAMIESQRGKLSGEEARIGFAGDKQEVYARLVALLLKTGAASGAFEVAERGKSRALVDLLASRGSFAVRAGASGEEAERLFKEYRLADTALATASAGQAAPAKVAQTRSVATEAARRLREKAPELAALVSVSHTPAAEVQALLRPDETIVEYFGHKDRLFAFVVGRQRIEGVALDAALLGRVAALRKSLQSPDSKDVQEQARALHAGLIEPLRLPAGGTLIVVPHGALHYLPFAVLENGKSSLLERYTLRVLPSASVMPLLARRPAPAGRETLILGNPDLRDARYDLPGAQKEAQEIARLRPGAKVLMRKEATREALSALGGQYAYLHLASHGTFDASAPRSSGLLLSPRPDAANPLDGMLTVDDLYGLRLDAELVTMSACETALADVQSGDDVVGLSRGFFYAGANNILASLWQVDDASTEQLMVQFYKGLSGPGGKAEALRRAQLALKAKQPHPFFWAAFQLAGIDAQPSGKAFAAPARAAKAK